MNTVLSKLIKPIKEVAIIVLGVSISFFVDKCKNNQQDEEAAKLLLKNLTIDLQKDSFQLEEMCAFSRNIEMVTQHLYDNIEQPLVMEDTLLYSIRRIGASSEFAPILTTYEEMKQNGLSKLIKNDKLKRNLYELYNNYYKDVSVVNQKVSYFADTEISSFLLKNLPYSKDMSLSKAQLAQVVTITKSDYYRNLLRAALKDKKMNRETYEQTLEKVKIILEILRKEK